MQIFDTNSSLDRYSVTIQPQNLQRNKADSILLKSP